MLAKGKAPIGVAVPEALGSYRCRKAGAVCQHSRGEMPEKARNQTRKGIDKSSMLSLPGLKVGVSCAC
jgi:hypothetical protein